MKEEASPPILLSCRAEAVLKYLDKHVVLPIQQLNITRQNSNYKAAKEIENLKERGLCSEFSALGPARLQHSGGDSEELFLFKRKMFLREITERYNKNRSADFCQRSIHAKGFNKYFQKEIVKQNRTQHHSHVFG